MTTFEDEVSSINDEAAHKTKHEIPLIPLYNYKKHLLLIIIMIPLDEAAEVRACPCALYIIRRCGQYPLSCEKLCFGLSIPSGYMLHIFCDVERQVDGVES